MSELNGKKVAFLAKRGLEQAELTEPWQAVEEAGGVPVLVSDEPGTVTALIHDWDRGEDFTVDVTLEGTSPEDYAALVLPGGTLNSDKLRSIEPAKKFVKAFLEADKPVAAVCHGAWILVEVDAVRGRKMTSVPRISSDLKNAGAEWVDEEFVRDGNLLTSRRPDDLPAFSKGLVEAVAEAGA